MKTCPYCKKTFATKAALKEHFASKHPAALAGASAPKTKRKTAKGKASSGFSPSGVSAVASMEEFWGTIKAGASAMTIAPGKSALARLDQYALMYQSYQIVKWDVRFTVRVGSTVDGMYLAGATYDPDDTADDASSVAALQPKVHSAIWRESTLSVPVARLNKQTWMMVPVGKYESGELADRVAGKVCMFVDGTKASIDVWVNYTVRFSGPTSSRDSPTVVKWVPNGRETSQWENEVGKKITEIPRLDVPLSVEIESSDANIWTSLSSWFPGARLVRTVTDGAVTLVNAVVPALERVALTTLSTAPVIMTLRPRPFHQPLTGGAAVPLGGLPSVASPGGQAGGPDRTSGPTDIDSESAIGELSEEGTRLVSQEQEIIRLKQEIETLKRSFAEICSFVKTRDDRSSE